MSERIGIEIPEIYDGISVWLEPDGTMTNRWAWHLDRLGEFTADPSHYQRRYDATQQWINERRGGAA